MRRSYADSISLAQAGRRLEQVARRQGPNTTGSVSKAARERVGRGPCGPEWSLADYGRRNRRWSATALDLGLFIFCQNVDTVGSGSLSAARSAPYGDQLVRCRRSGHRHLSDRALAAFVHPDQSRPELRRKCLPHCGTCASRLIYIKVRAK